MFIHLISYKILSLCAATLWMVLSVCLLLVPDFIYWIFGIVGNDTADLMSKRAAMLFLGLSILAFMSRDEPTSTLRQSLIIAFGASMFGLMCIGIFEFIRGEAGFGIWLAILVEMSFSICYFFLWRKAQSSV